jgi:hypothetical protein
MVVTTVSMFMDEKANPGSIMGNETHARANLST